MGFETTASGSDVGVQTKLRGLADGSNNLKMAKEVKEFFLNAMCGSRLSAQWQALEFSLHFLCFFICFTGTTRNNVRYVACLSTFEYRLVFGPKPENQCVIRVAWSYRNLDQE